MNLENSHNWLRNSINVIGDASKKIFVLYFIADGSDNIQITDNFMYCG